MAFITRVDTSTLSNQNIAVAPLLAHTYTNATRVRKLYFSVALDQIAGGGDYISYITRQHGGAGSAYQLVPTTTATVSSGSTSVEFESIALVAEVSDVMKVYVRGLAGDTVTPDIITQVFEELPALPGDAMLITSGTGTGQLSVTSGVVVASVTPAGMVLP